MPKKQINRSIYVIKSHDGFVKIGIAAQVRERFRVLCGASSVPLSLEYAAECHTSAAAEIEALVHGLFSSQRQNGEWFAISAGEAKAAIKRIAAQLKCKLYPYSIETDAPSIHQRLTETPSSETLRLWLVGQRAKEGINQTELARRLGWSRQCVSKMEVGEKRITVTELIELGKALRFDPREAFEKVIESASLPAEPPQPDQTQAL